MKDQKKPIVIMNWSMRQNHIKEAKAFAKQISEHKNSDIDVVILPSMGTMYPVYEALRNSTVQLGTQNIAPIEVGELSGEFSIESLIDMKGTFVEFGHWERRKFFNETDSVINKKVKLALKKDVNAILCVGEFEKKDADNVIEVLLQSSKMNNTSLTLAIVYAGIPNNIFISVQTENPKRVPSFRFFLYNPRMASMPLIVVEAVRKLR